MSVPLLDLRRQYEGIREEVLAAIIRVCDSQSFILGPEVEALEREIAALTGAAAAVGCASGTEALYLALVGAGIQPGDSVITTAFSFFASASAIVRAGATPILVDVDPGTLNLDPKLVEQHLRADVTTAHPESPCTAGSCSGSKIRAILPVHLFGQCADMDAFDQIAREYNVAIVEDAAQAIGAEWRGAIKVDGHRTVKAHEPGAIAIESRGRRAGSLGATAAFSFYPTKNLSAYGDAGIATTTDPEVGEHMRRLRNHGSPRRYYHDEFGWNGRMDAIQAAVLRVKLPHIADWNDARRRQAATYDRLFARAGLASSASSLSGADASSQQLSEQEKSAHRITGQKIVEQKITEQQNSTPIRLLARDSRGTHVFHQYVIRAQRRDDLRKFLAERKIGTEIYYPLPLHLQPALSYLGLKAGDLPVAEQAAKEVLALPMFPELTEVEINRVVESIAEFYS